MDRSERLIYRDAVTGLCLYGEARGAPDSEDDILYRFEVFPARALPEYLMPPDPFDREGVDRAFFQMNEYLRARS